MQVIYSPVEISSPFYVIYFMLAWGGRSVLTRRLIIRFTCVICKHDGIIGRVNMDM